MVKFSELSTRFQSFANAEMFDHILQSPDEVSLPYPSMAIQKLYVRKCYEDVFELLLKNIEMESLASRNVSMKSYGISGTSGIGKSLFFVYILYRLLKDFPEKTLPLRPNRIIYQHGLDFTCFDLQTKLVLGISDWDASHCVEQPDTLYVLDGQAIPMASSCIALYIASSLPAEYTRFCEKRMAEEWYFPVWTLEELQTCRRQCYHAFSIEALEKNYAIYGGVPRWVFDKIRRNPTWMERALMDDDVVESVRIIRNGNPTLKYSDSHTLLHLIISNDGQYDFDHVDIASRYAGEQLWLLHSAKMITHLEDMFTRRPNDISRHLFEIYGHLLFSRGGETLKCRCLEDSKNSKFKLDNMKRRITFGKDSIPAALKSGSYYEPAGEYNLPALSSQAMFQFTVAAEHPIGGVQILDKLCKLYDESKLYFVVPPHHFATFKKQKFEATQGTEDVLPIVELKQYVLELPIVNLSKYFGRRQIN